MFIMAGCHAGKRALRSVVFIQGVVDDRFVCRQGVCAVAVSGQHALCAFARQGAFAGIAPVRQPLRTVCSVQRVDVPVFRSAIQTVSGSQQVSGAGCTARQLGNHSRRSYAPVRRRLHSRRREEQRCGFRFVLQEGLEAVLSEVVRQTAAVGRSPLPENRGAGQCHTQRQGRDVRAAAGRQSPQSAP